MDYVGQQQATIRGAGASLSADKAQTRDTLTGRLEEALKILYDADALVQELYGRLGSPVEKIGGAERTPGMAGFIMEVRSEALRLRDLLKGLAEAL